MKDHKNEDNPQNKDNHKIEDKPQNLLKWGLNQIFRQPKNGYDIKEKVTQNKEDVKIVNKLNYAEGLIISFPLVGGGYPSLRSTTRLSSSYR